MPDCPAGSQNTWIQQGKRFVRKIGKDCANDTKRQCPPVACQVPESKTNEGTKKDMGEDEHGRNLAIRAGQRRTEKWLQVALLIRRLAVDGFLEDLDIGNIMLA